MSDCSVAAGSSYLELQYVTKDFLQSSSHSDAVGSDSGPVPTQSRTSSSLIPVS